MIIAGMYLGIPSVVLTHGNAERDVLAKKLLSAVTSSNLDLEDASDDAIPVVASFGAVMPSRTVNVKKLVQILQQKKTICIGDTGHQVTAIANAIHMWRKKNSSMAFQIIVDECDAMMRTNSSDQAFERAFMKLKGLDPRVCSYASATPLAVIPALVKEEKERWHKSEGLSYSTWRSVRRL